MRRCEFAHESNAVEVRHHDVRDQEIGPLATNGLKGLPTVRNRRDFVSVLEKPGHVGSEVGVIVRKQHAQPAVGGYARDLCNRIDPTGVARIGVGNHRNASSTKGLARICDAGARPEAPMRSIGKCAVPKGIVTVKLVPLPTSL